MKSAAASNPPLGNPEAPRFRHAMTDLWRALAADVFQTYQPEKHYMRGPGPKWRERHACDEALDRGTIDPDEFCSAGRSAFRSG